MRFSVAVAVAALFSSVAVSAVDILVKVGANNGLVFDPTDVTAAVGDTISFQFQGKNHSVTQSTFASPCVQQATPTLGVDSGFMLVPPDATSLPQWTITINNATTPLWFFCAQTAPVSHCGMGMVFAVNAPPTKTFAQFQAAAKASVGNTTISAPTAGASGTTGTPGSGTTDGNATPSVSTSSTASGAMRIGGNAAGVLTAAAVLTFITSVL